MIPSCNVYNARPSSVQAMKLLAESTITNLWFGVRIVGGKGDGMVDGVPNYLNWTGLQCRAQLSQLVTPDGLHQGGLMSPVRVCSLGLHLAMTTLLKVLIIK
jgi:hypothetical protein